MTTQLFLRLADVAVSNRWQSGTNDADFTGTPRGWNYGSLDLSRGASVQSPFVDTVAGPTSGVSISTRFVSAPLAADVTISGTVTFGLWASESSMSANAAINGYLGRIDGATGAVTDISKGTNASELSTSITGWSIAKAPTSTACKRGDRLLVIIFADDAGTMASGFAVTFTYNGATAGASGDSYVQITENLTFESTPAGSVVYPTDTASGFPHAVLDTGFVSGGTYENIDRSGLVGWSNPGNASSSNDTYAIAIDTGAGSDYLVCRNFGFSLPAGSAIRGIIVRLEAKCLTGTSDLVFGLQDASGALLATAGNSTALSASDSTNDQGGANYVWGAPSIDWAMVNDPDFGVRVWSDGGASDTYSVDLIQMQVFYQDQGIYVAREARTSRGAGVQNDVVSTVNGYTNPIQVTDLADWAAVEWYTKGLTSFTLGGAVAVNFRIKESAGVAQATGRCEVAICASDGTGCTAWGVTTSTSEIPISEADYQFWVSGDDTSVSDGARLRIRALIDDVADSSGNQMQAGQTVTLYYAGTSGGASGDTYLTFSQTLTEFVPVANYAWPRLTVRKNRCILL